jgi:pimeloyl-ACP methyl ester carboxylesterase
LNTRVMRSDEWSNPPRPVQREVLTEQPDTPQDRPPVLFVPGYGHGAWAYAQHWLEHAARRGFPASAMSQRGHGGPSILTPAPLRGRARSGSRRRRRGARAGS